MESPNVTGVLRMIYGQVKEAINVIQTSRNIYLFMYNFMKSPQEIMIMFVRAGNYLLICIGGSHPAGVAECDGHVGLIA